jgi:hypothetical protein
LEILQWPIGFLAAARGAGNHEVVEPVGTAAALGHDMVAMGATRGKWLRFKRFPAVEACASVERERPRERALGPRRS